MTTNPPLAQDRLADAVDNLRKYGYAMFPQQQAIYWQIGARLSPSDFVVEAGCGLGTGTAILQWAGHLNNRIIGTDGDQRNVTSAKALYPWLTFETWDLKDGPKIHGSVTVAVEVFEHVEDGPKALEHLILSARDKLWLTTPNGSGKPMPPSNPHHVKEYTPHEMLMLFEGNPRAKNVSIRNWENFDETLLPFTDVDPLVYEVELKP